MPEEPKVVAVPVGDVDPEAIYEEDKKPNETIAKECLAGRWGRGNVRKSKLRGAGYDPAEIEAEIDKIHNPS